MDKEFSEAKKNGVKTVDLSIFKVLDSYKPSQYIVDEALYTIESYVEFSDVVNNLSDTFRNSYMKIAKTSDVKDNQELEKEDLFLIEIGQSIDTYCAVDLLIKNYGKNITSSQFVGVHDYLLTGTSSKELTGLRTDNYGYVGYFDEGKRVFEYFLLNYQDIPTAIYMFLSYYNSNINDVTDESNCYIKPIIYHGLISALQMFRDGNTRYGRLFQNVESWGMLNNLIDKKLEFPIVYSTRQFIPYYEEYRKFIKEIAINCSNDTWDRWIKFNLHRFQDAINLGQANVEKIKRLN